jgi:hypothetical protein
LRPTVRVAIYLGLVVLCASIVIGCTGFEKNPVPTSNTQALYVIEDEKTSVYAPGQSVPTIVPIQYQIHAVFDKGGRLFTQGPTYWLTAYDGTVPSATYSIAAAGQFAPDQRGGAYVTDGTLLVHLNRSLNRQSQTRLLNTQEWNVALATLPNGALIVAEGDVLIEYAANANTPRRRIRLHGRVRLRYGWEQLTAVSSKGAAAIKTTKGIEVLDAGATATKLIPTGFVEYFAFDHRGNLYATRYQSDGASNGIGVYATETFEQARTIRYGFRVAHELTFDDQDNLYALVNNPNDFMLPWVQGPMLNVYARDSDHLIYSSPIFGRRILFGPLPNVRRAPAH